MTVYLDTSSLVKRYVEEAGSDDVRELVAHAAVIATSIVAYAETRATFARLRRTGDLSPTKLAGAKRDFEAQWPSFLILAIDAAIGVKLETWQNDTRCAVSTRCISHRSRKSLGAPALMTLGSPASMSD